MKTLFVTGIPRVNQLVIEHYKNDIEVLGELARIDDLEYEMNSETELVIINGLLEGDSAGQDLSEKLVTYKRKFPTIQFVIVIAEINETFRMNMGRIGIFDVIETDETGGLSPQKIFDCIDKPNTAIEIKEKHIEVELEEKKNSGETINFLNVMSNTFRPKFKYINNNVVAVWAPNSYGKTLTTIHLSAALANKFKLNTIGVDLDPVGPDMGKYMGKKVVSGLSECLEEIQNPAATEQSINSFVSQGLSGNHALLYSSGSLMDFHHAKQEDYEKLIQLLSNQYPFVVLDTNSYMGMAGTYAALSTAKHVIVPILGTKHDIELVNRYIDMFKRYGDFDVTKFKALVNRYDGGDLTFVEIEAQLSIPVVAYIKENRKLRRGINKNKRYLKQYEKVID